MTEQQTQQPTAEQEGVLHTTPEQQKAIDMARATETSAYNDYQQEQAMQFLQNRCVMLQANIILKDQALDERAVIIGRQQQEITDLREQVEHLRREITEIAPAPDPADPEEQVHEVTEVQTPQQAAPQPQEQMPDA